VSGKSHPYVLALMVCADPTRQHYTEDEQHAQLLDHAFSLNFEGDSVDLFCKSMQEYANAFDPEKYYGKIIAWHGPSGAGKSKGVDALQDKVRAGYPSLNW
jgi:hypothetical protein